MKNIENFGMQKGVYIKCGTKLIMEGYKKFGTKCGTRLNKHKLQNSPWNASCVHVASHVSTDTGIIRLCLNVATFTFCYTRILINIHTVTVEWNPSNPTS